MGFGKTGTTFLQSTLYANREILEKEGLIYPEKIGLHRESGAHHLLSHEWGGWLPAEVTNDTDYREVWRQLAKLSIQRDTNVLVSSEAFLGHLFRGADSFPSDLKSYLGGVPVRLLFYIRRQDDYLESQYRQLVKARFYGKGIHDFLTEYGVLGDFSKTLDVLADTFGDDSLVVRVYDRQKMPQGSIFCDVLGLFNIQTEGVNWRGGGNSNPSLSNEAILRVLQANTIKNPIKRRDAISNITMVDTQKNRGLESSPLLSEEHRIEIMEKFEFINRKIGARYFYIKDKSPFDKDMTSSP